MGPQRLGRSCSVVASSQQTGVRPAPPSGVVGLTQTIAKEYGPHGIRANLICPGGMDEPELREMYAERAKNLAMSVEAHEQQILSLTPLRKYAKHEEVANAALFLASSDSSHTTGESLNVSGGRLMS